MIAISYASYHDLPVFRQIAPKQDKLRKEQNVEVAIPIKLNQGQKILDSADKLYSTAVSRIRQPIESLFNRLNEKTSIQRASKVRSSKGLIVHVFGKLAAGLMMLDF